MRSWGERQSAGHRAELNRGPRLGGKQSGADALRRAGQGRAGGSRASRAHGFATTGLGERPRLINQKIIESPHALPLLPRCRFLLFFWIEPRRSIAREEEEPTGAVQNLTLQLQPSSRE